MDIALFDYHLPPERIAQDPASPRDAARMMVLDRARGADAAPVDACVADLFDWLRPGDLLVVNDTRVIRARVRGRKASGGRVELFFLEALAGLRGGAGATAGADDGPGEFWRVLLGASRAPARGADLELPEGAVAEVVEPPGAGGVAVVRVAVPRGGVLAWLERVGEMPLPPYIARPADDPRRDADRERYQTVYARAPGAVAAPTAGLHFTPRLLAALEERGVARTAVTLHVGEGTFRPLQVSDTDAVVLHGERFEVGADASAAIAAARARGGRVVAVGTTVVRTLESRPTSADGAPEPGSGTTALFIAPGHRFRHVDALLTNFHLPQSSLLMLVAAFAGRERVLDAYRAAVDRGYRFYSYGDAMLIL